MDGIVRTRDTVMLGWSHQPADYDCPMCRIVAGGETDHSHQSDVVLRTNAVTAFISAAWWPENAGHVVVVPNRHFENIYDIPDNLLAAVQIAGRRVAVALRVAYECNGTSFRQHNEPAGNQDVWHYHLHVFPRYSRDELYGRHTERRWTTPLEREPYAQRLRAYFALAGDTHQPADNLDERDLIERSGA